MKQIYTSLQQPLREIMILIWVSLAQALIATKLVKFKNLFELRTQHLMQGGTHYVCLICNDTKSLPNINS